MLGIKEKKKLKFAVIIAFILSIVFLFSSAVLAQTTTGGLTNEFASTAGLGTTDIRLTIASIIRTVMGFLGVVALIITLYGGFVYQTAGGNPDRVALAKKILLGGIIGLVITLASFSIAWFAVSSLSAATGLGGGNENQPPSGCVGAYCSGGTAIFKIDSFSPTGVIGIRNATVRVVFNRNIDPGTLVGNILIKKNSDNSVVAGSLTATGSVAEFAPDTDCPAPNNTRKCFDAKTEYSVVVLDGALGLKSQDSKPLVCNGFGLTCSESFTTGDLVDTAAPTISLTSPLAGESVSVNDSIPLRASAADDAGISLVEFYVDNNLIGVDAPMVSPKPVSYGALVNWDTAGVALGSTHTIKVKAYDIDSNSRESDTISVLARAAHCFDGTRNLDELDVDCGGNDCGACSGGSCNQNSDCSSGYCDPDLKVCVEQPVIVWVEPNNGAVGNLITIYGENFGSTPGRVIFPGGVNINTAPEGCSNTSWWQSKQIVVAVPAGAAKGSIEMVTSRNLSDKTNDSRGPVLDDFQVNSVVRPGLCALDPQVGKFDAKIKFIGKNFGNTKGDVEFGLEPATAIGAWADQLISDVAVPNLSPGVVRVQARLGDEYSNALDFTIQETPNLPHIDYLDPLSGPAGQYVTIYGNSFGASGRVVFTDSTGAEQDADIDFPAACSSQYWHDTFIIVKVPALAEGEAKIQVKRQDGLASNLADFNINKLPLKPGICRIDPDNGPEQSTVKVYGERFGSQGNMTFWKETQATPPDAWADREITTKVSTGAKTGPANAVDSSQTKSNDYNFRVGQCPKDFACYQGENCCNGSCQTPACQVVGANLSHYAWTFHTGAAIFGTMPQVLERDCASSKTANLAMSPNPYKGTVENCKEASMMVKFNTPMKASTLNSGNIIVRKCTGEDSGCTGAVSGAIEVLPNGTNEGGFSFQPNPELITNTWYRVTLLADEPNGIQSESGLFLDGDKDGEEGDNYSWSFRIKTDASACTIDYVSVEPEDEVKLSLVDETQKYNSLPFAANCNLLNADTYDWSWQSSAANIASITENKNSAGTKVLSKQTAKALAEGTTLVSAEAKGTGKNDKSSLVVDLNLPIINSITPDNGIAADYATTYITIKGQNFGNQRGGSYVLIGNKAAEIACTQWSDTEIIAIVPPGLGNLPVQVITDGGISNNKIFSVNNIIRPNICQIVPNFGKAGDPTEIMGSNFGDTYKHGINSALNSYFEFFNTGWSNKRGDSATVNSPDIVNWANNVIKNKVPADTATGNVRVNVLQQSSNTVAFTARPFISRLSPDKGRVGTWVTIFGGNFGKDRGHVYFYQNGGASSTQGDVTANNLIEAEIAPCASAWSDTQIVVVAPANAETGLVRVETNMSLPYVSLITKPEDSKQFTVNNDPLGPGICELVPDHGEIGNSVVVNGDRFENNPENGQLIFAVGRSIAFPATTWANNQINASVPAATITGPVKVTKTITIVTGRQCTGIPFLGVCFGGSWQDIKEKLNVESNEVMYKIVPPGSCTSNRDCTACAGSVCDMAIGQCTPAITGFTPNNGAVSTWVTVDGCYFGCTKGKVYFTNNQEALWPNSTICGNTWQCYGDGRSQIVAEVPNKLDATKNAITGPIRVTRDDGASVSATSSFTVNNNLQTVRICNVIPVAGEVANTVQVLGEGFGTMRNMSPIGITVACGANITADTLMNNDLNCSSGNGINIGADNITLDCGNHTIARLGTTGTPYGVYLNGRKNVTIKNCILTNWYHDIFLNTSSNNIIANNRLLDTVTVGNSRGIRFVGSTGNQLNNNVSCQHSYLDIENATGNIGSNNYCDKASGISCNNPCSSAPAAAVPSSQVSDNIAFKEKMAISFVDTTTESICPANGWSENKICAKVPSGWGTIPTIGIEAPVTVIKGNDTSNDRRFTVLPTITTTTCAAGQTACGQGCCNSGDACNPAGNGGAGQCDSIVCGAPTPTTCGATCCSVSCNNGVCPAGGPGSPCTSNSDCAGNLTCVAGVCTSTGNLCGNNQVDAGEQCDRVSGQTSYSGAGTLCADVCGADFRPQSCNATCMVDSCVDPQGRVCRFVCHNYNATREPPYPATPIKGVRECWVDLNNDNEEQADEFGAPTKDPDTGANKCLLGGVTYDPSGVEQCDDQSYGGLMCPNTTSTANLRCLTPVEDKCSREFTENGQTVTKIFPSTHPICIKNICWSDVNSNNNIDLTNDTLVSHWKMDEGGGTDIIDVMGRNNGYLDHYGGTGAPRPYPSWVRGKFGKAIKLNGNNNYVSVPASPTLYDNWQNGITVELWAKSSTATWNSTAMLLDRFPSFAFWPSAGTKTLAFQVWRTDYNFNRTPGEAKYTSTKDLTQWHHYAATYDNRDIKIYEDGVLMKTTAFPGYIYPYNIGLSIGSYSQTGGINVFNGAIDEAKIFNSALPADQIQQEYLVNASSKEIFNIDSVTCENDLAAVKFNPSAATSIPGRLGCQVDYSSCSTGGGTTPLPGQVLPAVERWLPQGQSVCLNAAAEVDFNQLMKETTLTADNILFEKCDTEACASAGSIDANIVLKVESNKSVVTIAPAGIAPNNLLEPNTWYRVTVKGGAAGVKSEAGNLNLDGGDFSWTWKTSQTNVGTTYCKISKVEVSIVPPGGEKYEDFYLCAGEDNCSDDQASSINGNQHEYVATAKDASGLPLQAAYTWWHDKDNAVKTFDPLGTIGILNKSGGNPLVGADGMETLNNPDIYVTGQPKQDAKAVLPVTAQGTCGAAFDCGTAEAKVEIKIFLCQNPWPPKDGETWSPYRDTSTCGGATCLNSNFGTYYCRDKGRANDTGDDLPALVYPPVVKAGEAGSDLFKEFLFIRNLSAAGYDNSPDVVGIRILKNIDHLPPLKWYMQKFPQPGTPSIINMDGYTAVKDGRTIYANAANWVGYCASSNAGVSCTSNSNCTAGQKCLDDLYSGYKYCGNPTNIACSSNNECSGATPYCLLAESFYTNIYLNSYNENANKNTLEIYDQMMKYWSFNANLPLDKKEQLIRDTRRLEDLNTIKDLLDAYKVKFGKYPTLDAGTFVAGSSLSIWPSWQAVLGNLLGTKLPTDPINKIKFTPAESESSTYTNVCPDKICTSGEATKIGKACLNTAACGKTAAGSVGVCEQLYCSNNPTQQCVLGEQPKCSPCPAPYDPNTCWSESLKRFYFSL